MDDMASPNLQGIQGARDQLQRVLEIWRSQKSNLPNPFAFNATSLTPSDIEESMKSCLDQLSAVCSKTDLDPVLVAVHTPGITSVATQLTNFVQINNPSLTGQNLQGIVNHVWSLQSQLLWLTPFDVERSVFAKQKASEFEKKALALNSAVADIEEINKAKDGIQASRTEIAAASATFQSSAQKIAGDREAIGQYLQDLEKIVNAQNKEIEEFKKAQQHIKDALEGSSQLGLAKSFMIECRRHKAMVVLWEKRVNYGFKFLITAGGIETFLVLYIATTGKSFHDLLTLQPYLLPLLSTAVFYLWYSIKQRGIYRNLAEDYAFKQATAMSFYGYRTEMGDDYETLKHLRQVAIENFGANPLRLLQKDEPASPIHDGLDPKKLEAITKAAKDLKDIFK